MIDPNNDIDLEGKEWSFLSKSSLQCDSHSQTPSHKDHLSEWLSTGRVPSLMFENVTFQSDCTSNFGQPVMIVHWKHCPMCSFIFICIGIPLSYQMNGFFAMLQLSQWCHMQLSAERFSSSSKLYDSQVCISVFCDLCHNLHSSAQLRW